ncbi:MAG TPA: HAMP domain-containing sensor histidine kinase [Gemmatimonadaceae bacterium]|nr:HAMP domain-containing sensor histidine kinase [Gemmatimonadaceae bacterium]
MAAAGPRQSDDSGGVEGAAGEQREHEGVEPARTASRRGRGTEPTTPVDVRASTWRALTGAAADVTASWPLGEHTAASTADVRTAVGILADAVRQAAIGGPLRVGGLPTFLPARRVLERLRRTFLEHAEAADVRDHAAGILVIVHAFERVQIELDLDAAHRFASRLSGDDAQQLVVEMAHDMRSPLGSILILAERLRAGAGGDLSAIQQRQLGLIYSAAFGLSALAGDVIELARGGTTLVDQDPIPFSVSDVLQSILDILRPMAEEKRLTMKAVGPAGDVRVGHPSALNRVLLNLATNAIKFTNAGSVEVLCRELDRARIEFSVRDTGRGIPDRVLANLFESFRQRQVPGDYAFSSAGLGLSICQKLVRAMGGELHVETELEKGTRFHFTVELPQPARM